MLPVEQLVETAGCEGALLLWVRCAAWRGGLPEEAAAAVDWATVFGWSGAALRALLRAYGESAPNTSKATKASNAAKGSNEGNIFRTKFLQKKLRRTKYPALCFVKSVRQV